MKQHHLGSWKQLVTGFAIGTAFLALTVAAATPSNVSLTYKAHSELTDAQKAQVNPGIPNEQIIQAQVDYVLVYDKESGSVTPVSKTGKALPSTGVDQSISTFVAGLGLLGLSGYLFFRHKKTRKYLIVLLAASGAGLTGFSAQAAARALGDVVSDTTTIGVTYTYSPEQIIGDYHYVGYIVEQKQLQPVQLPQPLHLLKRPVASSSATLTLLAIRLRMTPQLSNKRLVPAMMYRAWGTKCITTLKRMESKLVSTVLWIYQSLYQPLIDNGWKITIVELLIQPKD